MKKNTSNGKSITYNSGWCFSIVNGKLAEIFFDERFGIYGHCYVKHTEYTKREQNMINADLKKYRFVYRNDHYFDQIRKCKQKRPRIEQVFPDIKKYKRKK